MKNLVHCFSSTILSTFLETLARDSCRGTLNLLSPSFMQRTYERQWNAPTMIGFYLTTKWAELLSKTDNPAIALLLQALRDGIDENGPIDFVIAGEGRYQESHSNVSVCG